MLSESHPMIRRIIRFCMLPYCFARQINWTECTKPKWKVAADLLYIFFVLKDFPEHYGACRLWERPRAEWALYYGSGYNPYQRVRLRTEVQPYTALVVYDDKEICATLCEKLGIPTPHVYGVLAPGDNGAHKLRAIFRTVASRRLMIKPVTGSAGSGIILAEDTEQGIRIYRGQQVSQAEDFAPSGRYVIQQALVQHPDLAAVAPSSVNTLRVATLLTRSGEVVIVGALMRFGVGSMYVDNWSAGGIAVGVDFRTGRLRGPGYDKQGARHTRHPVSHIEFSGYQLPHWQQAVELGTLTQQTLPFVKILGLDIAFTESGAVLIEINSAPGFVSLEQVSGPFLASFETWAAFADYDLLYNTKQRHLHERTQPSLATAATRTTAVQIVPPGSSPHHNQGCAEPAEALHGTPIRASDG
jgi:hypothetical protein